MYFYLYIPQTGLKFLTRQFYENQMHKFPVKLGQICFSHLFACIRDVIVVVFLNQITHCHVVSFAMWQLVIGLKSRHGGVLVSHFQFCRLNIFKGSRRRRKMYVWYIKHLTLALATRIKEISAMFDQVNIFRLPTCKSHVMFLCICTNAPTVMS